MLGVAAVAPGLAAPMPKLHVPPEAEANDSGGHAMRANSNAGRIERRGIKRVVVMDGNFHEYISIPCNFHKIVVIPAMSKADWAEAR